jgi:hypothetical protein
MTACPVHVVALPGCPHPNPADTYRASQTDAVTVVTPIVGDPADIIDLLNAAAGNDQDGED